MNLSEFTDMNGYEKFKFVTECIGILVAMWLIAMIFVGGFIELGWV